MTRAMEGEEGTTARPEIEADVSSCFGYDQVLPLANIPCIHSPCCQTPYITIFCPSIMTASQVTTVIRLLRDGVAFVADHGLDITDVNTLNHVDTRPSHLILTFCSPSVPKPHCHRLTSPSPAAPVAFFPSPSSIAPVIHNPFANEETNPRLRPRHRLWCFSSSLHAPQATEIPRIVCWRS